jgi:hypothetical protein
MYYGNFARLFSATTSGDELLADAVSAGEMTLLPGQDGLLSVVAGR